tara:strand:- start:106 stop:555 length:450 start_codon:yes stop_codon:yes gene_type:complete
MEGAATKEERKSLEEFKLIKVEREIAELELKLAEIDTAIKKNRYDIALAFRDLPQKDYQAIKEKKEAEIEELTLKETELNSQKLEKQAEKESLGAAKSSDGDMSVKSSPDSQDGGSKKKSSKKRRTRKKSSKKRRTRKKRSKKRRTRKY